MPATGISFVEGAAGAEKHRLPDGTHTSQRSERRMGELAATNPGPDCAGSTEYTPSKGASTATIEPM